MGKWSGLLALLKTSARRLHPTFSDPLNLKLHSFKVSEQWGRHFDKLLKNTGPADQPVPQNYGSSEMAKPVRRVLILDRQSGPEKMAQGWKGLRPQFDMTWFLVMGSIWLCSQSQPLHLCQVLSGGTCPRWCASSNKEFLLLCQPLPLLLCRPNSPSSSERCRPHRRKGHPDPGSLKKSHGCRFFFTAGCRWKKNWSSFLSATGHAAGHDILTQEWKSLTKFEQDTSERGLPGQLPSYTENPEAALEGQCIFLLHWIGHHILPSCWDSCSEIFLKTFIILWR